MTFSSSGKPRNASFSAYLRTGRIIISSRADRVETKFNPWHDPEDKRFTFAGSGAYFGQNSGAQQSLRMAKPPHRDEAVRLSTGRSQPQEEMTDAERGLIERQRQLRDPNNFSSYVVQRGDNLTKIAKSRRGLTASFLAYVNDIRDLNSLQAGKTLRIPNQEWLDALGRRDEKFRRELFYLSRHGVPPAPRTPSDSQVDLGSLPSIDDQIIADLKTFSSNGYTFQADPFDRVPYSASGKLQFGTRGKRSKTEQLNAGGSDRRPTDQGGHMIGSRFNGPREWFNHFAQDANFNNGAFKKLEIGWDKLGKAGHEVFVDITAHRKGQSKRPHELEVKWTVDGQPFRRKFPNEAGSK